MPTVLVNVLVAAIAVCSVHNAAALLGPQAAFAAERTRAGFRSTLIWRFYNLTRLQTLMR